MSGRFKWDPDVNITKRRPAGMTSKPDPNEETPVASSKGKVTKSKQVRRVYKQKSRLGVQGTEKRQSTELLKNWKYRNFKRCGNCGAYDTYESRNPEWTRTTRTKKMSELFPNVPPEIKSIARGEDGPTPDTTTYNVEVEVKFWCYKCGAINDEVIGKYEDDERFVPKGKTTFCADCGKDIVFSRGDLAWPTGEKDPATSRDDYRCNDCEEKEKFYRKHPEMRPKGGQ